VRGYSCIRFAEGDVMDIDVAQTALDINNPITVLSLMRCQREWELLAGLYKAPKKPSAAELGQRFEALMSRLDEETTYARR